jgi:predicted Zn-dependent protease
LIEGWGGERSSPANNQSSALAYQHVKTAGLFLLCLLAMTTRWGHSQDADQLALKSHRAKQLMAEGNFAEAVSLYRELTQAVPNNAGLRLNLGMALQMAGKKREAIPQLQQAVRLDPRLAPAWLFLGSTHLELGDAVAAVRSLSTALDLEPDQQQARQMLADALFSLERFQEAATQYRELTNSDPENAQPWYGLGRSYESLSSREFKTLQKTNPESAYIVALLAETQLRKQQFSSAFFLYRRVLERLPTLPGLHSALAEVYRQTGHPEWATIENKREAQRPPPVCPEQTLECNFLAGRYEDLIAGGEAKTAESLYWRSRAYNELALNAFARLGQLPPSAELHELKASIYSSQKKYSEAASEWQQALRLSPANTRIQKELAISLKLAQNYTAALPLLQELLRQEPTSPELNYLVGDTLLDQQRVEEAIPLLRRAVTQNPKLLPAHKSLARAQLAAGNTTAAISHLKIALPDDTDGSLHYQLAHAYQASGQSELAKKTIADYQKIQRSEEAARQGGQQEMEITAP